MKPSLFLACCASTLAAPLFAADTPPAPRAAPSALQSGIEAQYFDAKVRPGDDFYNFVNGKWLATTTIPEDKSSWGPVGVLRQESQERQRKLIEEAAASTAGSAEARKVGDLYKSFMDEARLETLGLKPLDAQFAAIDAVKDRAELPALIARLQQIGVTTPFDIDID